MLHDAATTVRPFAAKIGAMGNRANPKQGMQPIPLRLKAWRTDRGLSQEQLAETIGTTKATISRIENRKQNWDQAFLQAAAEALRCEPADLLMRDPSKAGGFWSIYDQLTAPERQMAERLIATIRGTGTDG